MSGRRPSRGVAAEAAVGHRLVAEAAALCGARRVLLLRDRAGSAEVESPGLGRGSTFSFSIVAPVVASPEPDRRRLLGRQPQLAGRRLLVVDDNATNRKVLTLQAGTWGMLTRDTASPAEALRWIDEGTAFDVAVLDMHMPEMDGLALAGALRRLRPRCRWSCSARSAGARRATRKAASTPTWASRSGSRTCSIPSPVCSPARSPRRPCRHALWPVCSRPDWPRAIRCASCSPRTT
jgi:CheY-like chemotaxis protein